jgi:hypothetical protein
MAPCDFWLFRKLKRPLKGTRFQTREDIMAPTTAELISRGFFGMLPTMAAPLGEVCGVPRELL